MTRIMINDYLLITYCAPENTWILFYENKVKNKICAKNALVFTL